jgi:hypothetical protein
LLTLFVVKLALVFGLIEGGAGLIGKCRDLDPELLSGGAFLAGNGGGPVETLGAIS